MAYLTDTNVLAEAARPQPDGRVSNWLHSQDRLQVSVVTVEEIAYGLAWRPKPRVAAVIQRLLTEHCTVHPVTYEIAREAGELRGRLRAVGETRTQAGMLVAATALVHGLILVTRNTGDFAGCGVALLNPFEV